MLHKISEFCNKINAIKIQSDKLYKLKYETKKSPIRDAEIDTLISDIQTMCMVVSKDKTKYSK